MEKFIVTTGKTIDLAVTAALQQLGMDRDSVSVEVLENAARKFSDNKQENYMQTKGVMKWKTQAL